MPNYKPTIAPFDLRQIPEYISRELERVGSSLRDNADQVLYMTIASSESLSAAVSANWKCSNSNVLRVSTSNTMTFTGIAFKEPFRQRVIINTGTGVAVIKSEGTESSTSFRFLLPTASWQLSANAAGIFWYDPFSSRHRGISRT